MALGLVLHMECAKQRIVTWQVVFDWLNTVHIVGVELKSISCVVPLVLLMPLTEDLFYPLHMQHKCRHRIVKTVLFVGAVAFLVFKIIP